VEGGGKPTPPNFTSDYGILDVMKGRVFLARHLAKHGPLRVVIEAELTEPYGQNDGTSIEFNMNVLSVRSLPTGGDDGTV
jgi:hypothetical protein